MRKSFSKVQNLSKTAINNIYIKKSANFFERLISTIILIPIVLFIVNAPMFIFAIGLTTVAIFASFEWGDITLNSLESHAKHQQKWQIIGVIYFIIPFACLFIIKTWENGNDIITITLFTVWASDTTSYIIGRRIKGPKLAPKISPKKTISGAIGGIAGSIIISCFAWILFSNESTILQFILIGIILSIAGQFGDLFESYIKRKFKTKDSGILIPGHGGMLDRIDSLLFASVMALILFGFIFRNIF